MFAAGQEDMRRMDEYTMHQLGLPGVVLMENAGARVTEEVLALKPRRAAVLAGGGNNGGDGFVIARRLNDAGVQSTLWLLTDPSRLKGDAKVHLDAYLRRGLPVYPAWQQGIGQLRESLQQHADVLVDAMLGTGVRGAVREPFAEAIGIVNEFCGVKPIIAVDIPSGLSSDDGSIGNTAVKADKTVTFVFPKKGFFLREGPMHIGEWKAVDISVPPSAAEALQLNMPRVITEADAAEALPKRPVAGHKGTFGHALVIGGSRPYAGAPMFTAKAALHSGAGLVTLAVPESVYPMAAAQAPEALMLPLAEHDGYMAEAALEQLRPLLAKVNTVAVGPGIGRFPGGEAWMKALMTALQQQHVVIDADALYLLRGQLDQLREYAGAVILTPHPGEMASLTGLAVRDIEADRLGIAQAFAQQHRVYLLLKGHRPIIASPSGGLFINPHGNDALGKGGSGDVLTGLIASFLAQGAGPEAAMIAASFVHARAGEERALTLSRYGVTPLDLISGVKEQLIRLT